MRAIKYLTGLWLGATLVAYAVAAVQLYLSTGNLLVPYKKGARLVPIDDAAHLVRALARPEEARHEASV